MHPLLTAGFIFLAMHCFGQAGYRVDMQVRGLSDTTAYLGYFLQEKTFIKDTARVGADGSFSFEGAQSLPEGMYFLVMNKNRMFDLVIGKDQHFSITTSADGYNTRAITGDIDNRLFYENIRFSTELNAEAAPHVRVLQDSASTEQQKEEAQENLGKINEKAIERQQTILDEHPATLTARLLRMNKPVAVPDPPKNADGSVDSTFQLYHYRAHYFDNFDLADEAMLRLPKVFYWEKVQDYLSRLFVQHPDTITNAINALVAKAKNNRETYRYLVWNCIVNYQNHEIMGLDEVYVNLVDRYIGTGEMDYWLDKRTIRNLKDHADKVRRAMIGRTAPNLIMQDENLRPRALYDLTNRYTIIFFFKPGCSHCREETPGLVNFYNAAKSRLDLEVFAVATDTSMQEMKEFIREFKTPWITVNGPRSYIKKHHSELYYADQTPMIYITDEKKKIIARKLAADQIGSFLTNYEIIRKRKEVQGGE